MSTTNIPISYIRATLVYSRTINDCSTAKYKLTTKLSTQIYVAVIHSISMLFFVVNMFLLVEISEFLAQPAHVALCLQHFRNFRSKSAVDDAVNALAWVHELGGLPSLTSHPTVRTMQESVKARPIVKKGTSNTTVATENDQYVSPGVSIIVGHTNCDCVSPGFLRIFPFQ